jgi:hypothetical protein
MVSSWLILQIASLLCSALALRNCTLKAILALLLVGFGAALFIDFAGQPVLRLTVRDKGYRKVHLIFWPAAAMLILGGTTLVSFRFLTPPRHPNRWVLKFDPPFRRSNPGRLSRHDAAWMMGRRFLEIGRSLPQKVLSA